MGDLSGRNLGPYVLLEQLGAGGMATVYKAYQPAMDRYVAVKVLPHHMASDAAFRERFGREARTIARLEHRFILPVYDVLEADGIPFLVMRYTTGGTLRDLLAAGRTPFPRALTLVAQVAEALAYAHAEGVVHRDIKPANILLDRDGSALLADFGIAKIVAGASDLTADGALIGTPLYMAPEQAQGRPADARTDIYALGVVLYELVAGRRPYEAETPLAVALMHIHDPLPLPRSLNPAIPEALERVILQALAKRPEDRFQSAGAMVEALRLAEPAVMASVQQAAATLVLPETQPQAPAISASPVPLAPPAPAPAPARRRPWVLGAGAFVLLAALALVVPRLVTPVAPATTAAIGSPTIAAESPAALSATALPISAAATAAPGPTLAPRAGLRVFSDASVGNAMVALGDTVWLATNGGLVRYDADGPPRIFTTADGLAFNDTGTLIAAPDGSLWAATYGRIANIRPVADGIGAVTAYDARDGFHFGNVPALLVDPADGAVWAGGDSGLWWFDGSRWQAPSIPLDDPAMAQFDGSFAALLRANDGALWIARGNGGLLRWDGARWSVYTAEQGVGQSEHYQLVQTSDGTLWVVAGIHGLLRFDASQDRWQQAVAAPDGGYALAVGQLADGRMWLATNADLQQSDDGGANWKLVDVPQGYLGNGTVVETSDGRLWVGGASTFANGAWTRLNLGGTLPFSGANRLVRAPDGKLWVLALYGGPAAIIDPQSLAVERDPLDERIYTVAFSADTIWFGTSNGLVRRRNEARSSLTAADGLPSDEVRQLLLTERELWIGTDRGLAVYDLATEQIRVVPEFADGIVEALLQGPDGAIWAGSHREDQQGYGLLGRFDGAEWRLWRAGELPNSEDRVEVTHLTADSSGAVWALTWSSGLYRWDGERWETWTDLDGAPQSTVMGATARDDTMLIGGDLGAQLFRWSADGWGTIPVAGISGRVNAILHTDDGALWLATSDGLLRVAQ
jgi:ligand-binding sensor domain-containing protein/tRNA A-37 threonylcarbamoyl transferase component Bud32